MKKFLGHYEVLEKLGAGGMGEVYRVRDTILDRHVALKVLRIGLAGDPLHLRQFDREARAIAALDHPNIVKVYSVEEFDCVHFFTMELVEGCTLSDLYLQKGLELKRFLEIAGPLVSGISYAHSRGVTHRDLKPDNIIVNRVDGEAHLKVVDFGLAQHMRQAPAGLDAPPRGMQSPAGRVLGTVAYMSPEQAKGKPTGPSSDVFSLGVIMYEMLTGSAPFRGSTACATIESVLTEEPPPLLQVRPDLPRELSRIISRCMLKDARQRYPSAMELCSDMKMLMEFSTSVDPAPGGTRSGENRSIRADKLTARKHTRIRVLPTSGLFLDVDKDYSRRATGNVPKFFTSSADPVFATDENGQVVFWNRAMEKLDGREADEVLGRDCHRVICGRDLLGNRYCRKDCPVALLAAEGADLRRFKLVTRDAVGVRMAVSVTCFVHRGSQKPELMLFHTVKKLPDGVPGSGHSGDDETTWSSLADSKDRAKTEFPDLTRRQLEILRLLATGTKTPEIACSLSISNSTVRNQVRNILKKLDARSKLEAVVVANQKGLI